MPCTSAHDFIPIWFFNLLDLIGGDEPSCPFYRFLRVQPLNGRMSSILNHREGI